LRWHEVEPRLEDVFIHLLSSSRHSREASPASSHRRRPVLISDMGPGPSPG
jgi:hypothetical protein